MFDFFRKTEEPNILIKIVTGD